MVMIQKAKNGAPKIRAVCFDDCLPVGHIALAPLLEIMSLAVASKLQGFAEIEQMRLCNEGGITAPRDPPAPPS